MWSRTYTKVLIITVSLLFASQVACTYFNNKKKKRPKKSIHEVIMFSESCGELKYSKYCRCLIPESLDRLLYYLNTAKRTLDICMYVLTNIDLTNTVIKLHYRGVKVRVIVDADMAFVSGSTVTRLEKHSIPVRWMRNDHLMHHKFVLIDARFQDDNLTPLVFMGSLNWTNQALCGNWEDVTITSQNELVQQYRAEFERLWTFFKPVLDL